MSRTVRAGWRVHALLLLPLLLPLLLLVASPAECAAAQGSAAAESAERQVLISLEERRLFVMEGVRVVWSAPVGTGTGESLVGAGQTWDFSTPRGEFQIQRKELDPVWYLPDWVFVKRGERIPADESPLRREEGMLGAAALYLSTEIAIHGTDEPRLLGQEVSHGCIRMSNDDVLRLYDELEVGSPVIIF